MVIGAMNELKIGNTENLESDLALLISETAKHSLLAHITTMRERGFNIRAVHRSQKILENTPGHFLAPHIIEIKKYLI